MSAITYANFERDFRYEKRIGKGNCSFVNQVWHNIDQCSYAHKISYLNTSEELAQAFNEIETITKMDDETIIKIYYYYVKQKSQKNNKYEFGIIMELCAYNLTDLIKQRKKKNEFFTIEQLRQFLDAMIPFFAKMQRRNFVHRDIKPDNVLIAKSKNKTYSYKMADFGFAVRLSKYSSQNIAGTMEYASPKLLDKFKDSKITVPGHTFKDDVYSLGKTIFEFMTLELNGSLNPKKTQQVQGFYGSTYNILVMMMLKSKQNDRPDFIFLENYCQRRKLIQSSAQSFSTEPKRAMLHSQIKIEADRGSSSSTTADISKKNTRQSKKSAEKRKDKSKTKKGKQASNQDSLVIENLRESKVYTPFVSKKSLDYKDPINCIAYANDIIYLGSSGNIGLYHLKTEKTVKIKFDKSLKIITCLKVDSQNATIMFGSTSGKFNIASISQILKLLQKGTFLKNNNGIYELTIDKFPGFQVTMQYAISSFDSFTHKDLKQCYLIGFFSGEISIIKDKQPFKLLSLNNQAISCVKYSDGCVYSSNVLGNFKRQSLTTIGLWMMDYQLTNILRSSSAQIQQDYQHKEPILTFEIISNCSYNKQVKKQSEKYLAILITYDGFFHIINNAMQCEKITRISHFEIHAGYFMSDPTSNVGVRAVFADSDGVLFNEQCKEIEKTGQKSISSIMVKGGYTVLGSYERALTILKMRQKK